MSECEKEEILGLLEGVHKTLVVQDEQRKRGLNDYNLLTSVLRPGDEVRLHSRFIYSMINPDGKHYQGSLFLRLFKENVLQNSELDLDSARVYKEWKGGDENGGIDLFLTDGNQFLIIENKIYAADQYWQIARYLKAVINEYPEANENNVFVYYLTPKKRRPSKVSLGNFKLDGEYMKYIDDVVDQDRCFRNKRFSYCNVTYDDHIIKWVDSCLKETCNLTNINQAFLTYKEVVQHIIKKKENKVVTISNYLSNDVEKIFCAGELEKEMPAFKGRLLCEFFDDVKSFVSESHGEIKVVNDKEYIKGYNEGNCISWFARKNRDYKDVGITFDISKDVFLCVMVADEVLHIGVIPKVGCKRELEEPGIEVRKWKRNKWDWYSYAYINIFNFNKDAIELLLNKGNSRKNVKDKISYLVCRFGNQ